jgi:histidinol-phosphate aminotransferase
MGHDGDVIGDPHTPAGAEPARVVLGVGASRGCPPEELSALADAVLAEAGLGRAAVVAVASAEVKADEPAVLALAAALGVPARFLPADALGAVDVPTPSAVVLAHVGTPSVAEAAALLVAAGPDGDGAVLPVPAGADDGMPPAAESVPPADPAFPGADPGSTDSASPAPPPGARLLVPKRRSARATCAIAVPAPTPRLRAAALEVPLP